MSDYKFPISRCPKCGYSWFSIKQRITGIGTYYGNLETGEIETQDLHEGLDYRNINKYAVCARCGKRLFKVDDSLTEYIK